jgi:hypothetical protein
VQNESISNGGVEDALHHDRLRRRRRRQLEDRASSSTVAYAGDRAPAAGDVLYRCRRLRVSPVPSTNTTWYQ